jgi:hypothetical protein
LSASRQIIAPSADHRTGVILFNHADFRLAERRRSRTYQPMGYIGLPVLKTGWATGPVPLQEGGA